MSARAKDDPNLHHLDGRALYGEADHARLPLPDRLHPDAAAHRLIGKRFAAHAFAARRPVRRPWELTGPVAAPPWGGHRP